MPQPIRRNTLFYGDNLPVMREHIPDQCVDLIYLDPPFNVRHTYNILFRDESGQESETQIASFDDAWHWDSAVERTFDTLVAGPDAVGRILAALHDTIGSNQIMAYLAMLAARLVELRRILKPTGSLYLHCDPTASAYSKVVLDAIFGPENFRNEIIWTRHSGLGNVSKRYGSVHDVILFYVASEEATWRQAYGEYDPEYVEKHFRYVEPETGRRYQAQNATNPNPDRPNLEYEWHGHTRVWKWTKENMEALDRQGRLHYSSTGFTRLKQYLDESAGPKIQDVWNDIQSLATSTSERLGYPTQKPLALLERIILASSHEGDWVLDPFCGCGTAVHAAEKLGRRWIGIDVTYLATSLIKNRLRTAFGLEARQDYDVIGEPEDFASAQRLAQQNGCQFQIWAKSLISAQVEAGAKGAGEETDGVITFIDEARAAPKRVIIQVESGRVGISQIRSLIEIVEREKATMGIVITLESPTESMLAEAARAGDYHSPLWNRAYPRIQIRTIEQLLKGDMPKIPPVMLARKQADREPPNAQQGRLDL